MQLYVLQIMEIAFGFDPQLICFFQVYLGLCPRQPDDVIEEAVKVKICSDLCDILAKQDTG